MKSDVSRTHTATPSNGGALPTTTAPRLSDRLENALHVMNIPADLVESLCRLPQDKREEAEKHLIPALGTASTAAITHYATGQPIDYTAIRAQYPVDIAEAMITGIEKGTKNTCKGDTHNDK